MKIRIHRGTNQIGGCVTEYEYKGWHLFVDYGEELPGGPKTGELQVEGLTHGDLSKSALLITHYHGDHIGCITKLPKALPIYMGEVGREIQLVLSNHLKNVMPAHKEMVDLLKNVRTFKAGKDFTFGPFSIMPVTVDHSAFDAYAFRIEADGVSAYHTGDFRLHGFRSGRFFEMIEQYVGKVNYVVCEATNILRPNATSKKESALQRDFVSLFKEKKSTVVYLSSTNVDRLFSLYHAALEAGRPFYVDGYQKEIMDVVVNSKSMWTNSPLYQYKKPEPEPLMYHKFDKKRFFVSDSFKEHLSKKGYVLIARSSERFDDLLEQIPGQKQKVLSMWDGYVKEGTEAYNENLANSLDGEFDYMHTSGHIDMKDLREFFQILQPKAIIPIHTDNRDQFARQFCDEWPIIRLYDGQSISPISMYKGDSCSASIICSKELKDGIVYKNKEDWEKAHGVDVKTIGAFKTTEDSKFALGHTLYRPAALIGYEIEEEEDLSPAKRLTFDANKNLLATYTHGGHQPEGTKYQETCRFAAGEKALAMFEAPYDAVVPVKVIGPLTPESERESWEQNDTREYYDTYEDYVKDWDDWHWDSVAVHPLVKLKSGNYQMTDTETVPRAHLFPYGKTDEWGVTYSDNGKTLRHIDSKRFVCEEYTIPEGVEVIDFPFMCIEGKHLRKIHLPSSLRHMVDNTFIDCALEKLVLPEGMTEIPGCMCENCRELKKVVLPSTLKKIGNAAFCHCKKLKEIVLPDGLEVICDDAFGDCVSLKHLELPSSLKYIGPDTFLGSGVEHLSKFEHKDEDSASF